MAVSTPNAAKAFFVKLGLGIAGVICLALAGGMFFMGQVGGGKAGEAQDNIVFFLVLVVLGLGCFIAIEWYTAKSAPIPQRRTRFEDEESAQPEGGPSPELMQQLAAGLAAAQQDPNAPAVATPNGAPPPNGVIAGGEGTVTMNHLESADFIYTKLFDAPSEEVIAQLIQKAVVDLQAKGYSDKGLSGFVGKLQANLGKINPETMPEQVVKNTRRAQQVLGSIPIGGAG